ncbi:hypothetical protein D3C84_843650 [compost metagenome]
MSKYRRAFEQQAQGLPINRQAGFCGHPRKAPQVPVQAGATQGFAFQVERGVEQLQFALPVGHVHAEFFRDRAEAHTVFEIAWQKRRHMKGLGHGEMLMEIAQVIRCPGRQHVVITLAPRGIGDFGNDCRQLAVGFVTIKKAHRVERQAPTARLGQQADRTLWRMTNGLADLFAHRIDQAHAIAGEGFEVVAFAKRKRRETAVARQRR